MISSSIPSPGKVIGNHRAVFGCRMKELRLLRGLSQAELATQLHLSPTSINRYEHGLREPGLDTLKAVAEFFSVDFNHLLCQSSKQSQHCNADLISKFNALDERGKSAVLNVLNFEYESLPEEKAGSPAKNA